MWEKNGSPFGSDIVSISRGEAISTDVPILKAWLEPQKRTQWLGKALLQAKQALPDSQEVQTLQAGMERSESFDQWVKANAPQRQSPRVRAGFGVLSRHIDGPAPSDFVPVVENAVVVEFMTDLFPSPIYSPALDTALQPLRENLWLSIQAAEN